MSNQNRSLTEGTAVLRAAANQITSIANDFFTTYSNLFIKVNNDLANNWVGEDSTTFVTKANTYEPKFKEMYNIMNDYSNFLIQTATSYEQQIQDVKNVANTIEF
ncbi:MAG: WXG100 family type VII secretion target [Oscillospiraceae bacterium]|nr:WXG100 family type VII secretion target [Oscillospiraceae bacterium]